MTANNMKTNLIFFNKQSAIFLNLK